MPEPFAGEPAVLLAGWEAAVGQPAVARPAALLCRLGRIASWSTALDLDVGEYAARAAATYVECFGPDVEVLVECRACGECLEATLDLAVLVEAHARAREAVREGSGIASAGRVSVRGPTLRDLVAVGGDSDGAAALLSRCVMWADGGPVDAAALSADELDLVDDAAADLAGPAATAAVVARCPGCSDEVRAAIDVGALLWEAVTSAARRFLLEVTTLAEAFGWSEEAILALSPARRAGYLSLVEAGAPPGAS